jgi:hypothetical protein
VRDDKPELVELLPAPDGGAALMSNAQLVPTPAGGARITWYWADGPRAVLALGHGASTGLEARDLRSLAAMLRSAASRSRSLSSPGGSRAAWAATIPLGKSRTLDGQDHGVADEILVPVLVELFSCPLHAPAIRSFSGNSL